MANPNPSPDTRFGAPNGNPATLGGKTSEQRKTEFEAAEMAAKLRHRMLSVIVEKIEQGADPEEFLKGDILRLFKDSEDRAHGTPKSTSELSGPNGGAIPVSKVVYEVFDPKSDGD